MKGPASDGKLADSIDAGTNDGDEEDSEPAECIGHSLSDRGLVFMKLHWKDSKEKDSLHPVKGIMGSSLERKAFGRTWVAYCSSRGILEDQFRIMGVSVVEKVEGHDWAKCGHPVARIRWRHGEVASVLVKNAMEPKTADNNGFKAAWEAYCTGIDGANEALIKGTMDASRKKPANKRQRRT